MFILVVAALLAAAVWAGRRFLAAVPTTIYQPLSGSAATARSWFLWFLAGAALGAGFVAAFSVGWFLLPVAGLLIYVAAALPSPHRAVSLSGGGIGFLAAIVSMFLSVAAAVSVGVLIAVVGCLLVFVAVLRHDTGQARTPH